VTSTVTCTHCHKGTVTQLIGGYEAVLCPECKHVICPACGEANLRIVARIPQVYGILWCTCGGPHMLYANEEAINKSLVADAVGVSA